MMKPLSRVRFGLVGAGMISHWAAPVIQSHPDASITAATDPSAERLQELCRKHVIPRACATVEEMLALPEVDAVYIATPNRHHVPLALQAIRAGKHVILEKPFAMNAAEAREAIAAAEKADVVLTVGMNQRFDIESEKIKFQAASGFLGEIYHAKAWWKRRTGIPRLGTWFGQKDLAGGGALYDIGVHMLDLCLHIMDNFEPVSVTAATYAKFGPRGLGEGGWGLSDRGVAPFDVDDFATAFIRMRNGATVTLDAVWACHMAERDTHNVEFYGTEAGASVRPARLFRYGAVPGHDHYQVVESPLLPLPNPQCDRFINFIRHLTGQGPLLVPARESLVVQEILDAIADSARTGREVSLTPQS